VTPRFADIRLSVRDDEIRSASGKRVSVTRRDDLDVLEEP